MQHHPNGPPGQWPALATWSLTGRGEAVTQARDHVREFLTASAHTAPPATLRDGLLVVSELVTNAVVHAPGPCVLSLVYQNGRLTIGVHDTSPSLPAPRVPDPAAADGGFGWHLLVSLTYRIDVWSHDQHGKTITAVLREGHMPRMRDPQ